VSLAVRTEDIVVQVATNIGGPAAKKLGDADTEMFTLIKSNLGFMELYLVDIELVMRKTVIRDRIYTDKRPIDPAKRQKLEGLQPIMDRIKRYMDDFEVSVKCRNPNDSSSSSDIVIKSDANKLVAALKLIRE
jgi:hypothetical protein